MAQKRQSKIKDRVKSISTFYPVFNFGKNIVIVFGENGYVKTIVTIEKNMGFPTNWNTGTDNPQTGVHTNLALWFALLLTSIVGIETALIYRKEKQKDQIFVWQSN